ncbi:MAG: hypothetical protein ACHQ1H_11550 [Nitrososphaerales archaeon]
MQVSSDRRQEWKNRRQIIIDMMIRTATRNASNQLKILWGELRECERSLLTTCSEGTENWYEAKELLEMDKRENQVAALDPSIRLSLDAVQIETKDEGASLIRALEERQGIDPCDFPSLEVNSLPIKLALRSIESV